MGCHALLQGSSRPRDQTHISVSPALAGGFFTPEPPGKPCCRARCRNHQAGTAGRACERRTQPEGCSSLRLCIWGPLACSTFPPVKGPLWGCFKGSPLQSSDPCLRIRDRVLAGTRVYLQHFGGQRTTWKMGTILDKASAPVSTPRFLTPQELGGFVTKKGKNGSSRIS